LTRYWRLSQTHHGKRKAATSHNLIGTATKKERNMVKLLKKLVSLALASMIVLSLVNVKVYAESRTEWRFNFTNVGATGDVNDD
jgi:hypothetical protein